MILVLEDNLIFGSRVRAALSGLPMQSVYRLEGLAAAVQANRPRVVIVDVSGGPLDKLRAIAALRAAGIEKIIGIAGHKERAVRARAVSAGCHTVLPHSAVPTRLRMLVTA